MQFTPILIAQLVVQYGIPFAEYLIKLWQNKQNVGPDEWATLKSLVPSPEATLAAVAEKLGLAPDDPKVVAIGQLIAPKV